MRTSHPSVAVILALLAVFAAGCSPADPLERPVSAPTLKRFAAWRAHLASDSSIETRQRIESALQEIRIAAAGERELRRARGEPIAPGSEAIDEAVRARVDGRPLREVVQLGFEQRVQRLKAELAALEDSVDKNAQLLTKPGDTESRRHLDELRGRQLGRVEKYREELAAAQRELEPLMARTGRSVLPPKTAELTEVESLPKRVR